MQISMIWIFFKQTLMWWNCQRWQVMPNEVQGKTWPSQEFCCCSSFVCEPPKSNWAGEAWHVVLFGFCVSFTFRFWRSVCEPLRSNWADEAWHVVLINLVLWQFHFSLLAFCLWTSKVSLGWRGVTCCYVSAVSVFAVDVLFVNLQGLIGQTRRDMLLCFSFTCRCWRSVVHLKGLIGPMRSRCNQIRYSKWFLLAQNYVFWLAHSCFCGEGAEKFESKVQK